MCTVLLIFVVTAQQHNCGSLYRLKSFQKLEPNCLEVSMVSFLCYLSTPSMSRLVQPKCRSTRGSALRVLCVFLFRSCAVKDKTGSVCPAADRSAYMLMSPNYPDFTVLSAREGFPPGAADSCVDRKQW